MTPYRYVPGSVVDRVLKALDAAAEPMTLLQLHDAIEHTGGHLSAVLRRPIMLGVLSRTEGLYTRGETPTAIRERRSQYGRYPKDAWRDHVEMPAVLIGSLRTLLTDGASISTGDPLRALADTMDAARAVLASRGTTRFRGAEVELLVARELRSVTEAAMLATRTLQQALEVL